MTANILLFDGLKSIFKALLSYKETKLSTPFSNLLCYTSTTTIFF